MLWFQRRKAKREQDDRERLGPLYEKLGAQADDLLQIARALDFSTEAIRRMETLADVERINAFLDFIEGRHGGSVDWRGDPDDVYAALTPCLSEQERSALPPVEEVETDQPDRVLARLSAYLLPFGRRLLLLDGDWDDQFYFLIVPANRQSAVLSASRTLKLKPL